MATTVVSGTITAHTYQLASYLTYEVTTNNSTTYAVNVKGGIRIYTGRLHMSSSNATSKVSATGQTDTSATAAVYNPTSSTYDQQYVNVNYTWTKGAAANKTLSNLISFNSSSYFYGQTATASTTITVPAKTYTVSYNANGGTGAPASQTKTHGVTLTLSGTTPTRTGYTFAGWNTASNGTGTNYSAGGSYTANAAATLYAKWTAITYTVSYNKNTTDAVSNLPANQTKTYGSTLTLSSTKPTRTGYTFVKWNTNASGSGTSYNAGASYTANAAATLYAVWQINTWTVTYNANGGSGSIANQTKTYNQALTLSNGAGFTRSLYNLVGWATSASGAKAYNLGGSYTGNAALNLYAVWELAYVKPIINNFVCYRVATSGSTTETDDGEYIYISFDFVGGEVGGSAVSPTVVITIGGTTVYNTAQSSTTGTITQWFGTYSKDNAYAVSVKVYDSNYPTGTTKTATIQTAIYLIDAIGSGANVYAGVMHKAVSGQKLTLPETNVDGDLYVNNVQVYPQTIPAAYFYGGTTTNSGSTTGTWYSFAEFGSVTSNSIITVPAYYTYGTSGFFVEKHGIYKLSLNAHVNVVSLETTIMARFYNNSTAKQLGYIRYVSLWDRGFGALANECVAEIGSTGREAVILQFGRYDGTSLFRPTNVAFTIELLKLL